MKMRGPPHCMMPVTHDSPGPCRVTAAPSPTTQLALGDHRGRSGGLPGRAEDQDAGVPAPPMVGGVVSGGKRRVDEAVAGVATNTGSPTTPARADPLDRINGRAAGKGAGSNDGAGAGDGARARDGDGGKGDAGVGANGRVVATGGPGDSRPPGAVETFGSDYGTGLLVAPPAQHTPHTQHYSGSPRAGNPPTGNWADESHFLATQVILIGGWVGGSLSGWVGG